MQGITRLNSDPVSSLFCLNGDMSLHQNLTRLCLISHCRSLRWQKTVLCAINRRKRHGLERSSKIVLESACILASKFGLLPPPMVLLLRELGGGNGGGTGFWNGFGRGGFDGWKRRRQMKLGMVGIVAISCLGLGIALSKELVIDVNFVLSVLGLLLFGLSVNGWRKGSKDWILGFCSCGLLWCLASKKDGFRTWAKSVGSLKMNAGRRR